MGAHHSHTANDYHPEPQTQSILPGTTRVKRRKRSSNSTQRTIASRLVAFRSSRSNSRTTTTTTTSTTASTSSSNSISTPPQTFSHFSSHPPFSVDPKPAALAVTDVAAVEPTLRAADTANVVWIGGRHFRSILDTVHILPCDEEENNRLHLQHCVVRFAIQGNYLAPVSDMLRKGAVVLDVACNPGSWSMEIAGEYPKSKVIGMDFSLTLPSAVKPINCTFRQCNILERLPFDDGTFDYVFMRFVAHTVQITRWPSLVKELTRVLKQGGWLELVEMDLEMHRAGPNTQDCNRMVMTLLRKRDLDPRAGWRLEERLKAQPNLTNVTSSFISCPGGQWAGKLGQLTLQSWKAYYQALRPQISFDSSGSLEEYDEKLQASWTEVDEYKTFENVHFAYAQKLSL